MIGEITNHLWQSTVFAFAVGLVAIAFRKNRAEVRYWLWLSASLKFLLPFSPLIGVGMRVWDALPAGKIATHVAAPNVSQTMVEITQPFPENLRANFVGTSHNHMDSRRNSHPLGIWIFMRCSDARSQLVPHSRCRSHQHTGQHRRHNSCSFLRNFARTRSRPDSGVHFLLLPEGILKKLTPPQLEAVLAHEQCHVRRRDNLTSAFHMIVEAIFWFHPIVWWIGAKLIEERERACDEAVLKLGNEPQVYAEGILNVCKSYLESPLRLRFRRNWL